jgi:hypothetical protein
MKIARIPLCLRRLLLALFVIAQTAGVVPLMYDHTLNAYELAPVASHQHASVQPTIANPDADHHHGALDLHDQCCALHTLAAPLPYTLDLDRQDVGGGRIILAAVISSPQGRPALPDRPPRPLPLM